MSTDGQTRVVRGYCALCRSRCGALYTVKDLRLIGVAPDAEHPTGGALCAKGRAAPELAALPDRIMTPLRRTRPKTDPNPGWEPISWESALDEIAERLKRIAHEDGAHAVAFASTTPSGSGISDSIEWIESFVRSFGSPNFIAAMELCNFQKDHGHALTFGRPLGTPDYANADLIVLWGHNPARTWLTQANAISARRPATTLVVIDPQRSGSGQQASLWLGVRPGSDAALALGAIHHLIEHHRYNMAFVRDWTDATLLVDCETGRKLRADAIGGSRDCFVAIMPMGWRLPSTRGSLSTLRTTLRSSSTRRSAWPMDVGSAAKAFSRCWLKTSRRGRSSAWRTRRACSKAMSPLFTRCWHRLAARRTSCGRGQPRGRRRRRPRARLRRSLPCVTTWIRSAAIGGLDPCPPGICRCRRRIRERSAARPCPLVRRVMGMSRWQISAPRSRPGNPIPCARSWPLAPICWRVIQAVSAPRQPWRRSTSRSIAICS